MIMLPKEKREELVAKIEPLRQQVEAWRKARRPNEHMPESFWEPATQLAKEYGLAPVQGILRIDYRGLQRRVSAAHDAGAGPLQLFHGHLQFAAH